MRALFYSSGPVASRRSLVWLVAAVLALSATAVARPSPVSAASTQITSSGPLTRIEISDELNCAVNHVLDTAPEFFGDTACATLVATGGTLYGPSVIPAGGSASPRTTYSVISQSAVTGSGTSADPYRIVTVVDLGTSGLQISQTDSYVVGQESYRTDVQITNSAALPQAAVLYRAGDCFLQNSDNGFGSVDPTTGAVACVEGEPAPGGGFIPGDRIEQWFPLSAGSTYLEANFNTVWAAIGSQLPFPNTCECPTYLDNGAGLSWAISIPAGSSVTRSHLTTFSPVGAVPLAVTKTADDATSSPGDANGYTITISNPNPDEVSLSSITDILPSGFTYTAGSSTGATTTDPVIVGQELTWTGSFSVPGAGSLTLHFEVTVSSTPGVYLNEATADAGSLAVAGSGPTAPITVTGGPPPEPDSLTPAVVNETLRAGESTTVEKTLHLNGLPAAADIIVAIDTTFSMSGALVDAKADAVQICEDVKDAIPGARFAAVEFQDYPISPYGGPADSPYELHTAGYTADCATFGVAVAAMTLGDGADGPESNNRVHFEAYSDSVLLASRNADATRFLVVLADNVPHSTVAFGDCPATIAADGTPLSDPGRNGVNEEGGGDDIETPEAIDGLNADDHTLLYISYNRGSPAGSAVHPCHEDLAVATGGVAVASNDAEDIGAFIIDQAQETPYTVDLEVSAGCEIGFSFDPAPPYGPFTGEQTILFTEEITAPTVVGDYTCTITAVMTPGGPTTAVETVNVTVVPGDPSTLELEPAADTNTVDEEHCVTATVEDAFGNPTPGVTVEFSVSGPGETEGSATTNDDGEAEFCYTSALPGEDEISAFADTNGNGVQDPGEPSDTATKTWVLPASTEGCRVTYGGWIIATNGDRATFGGNAQADDLRGQQEYQDHGPAVVMNVHSIDVLAVECSTDGTEASIFGTATVDGEGEFDYRIDLKDLGDSGTDTYRLRLSNGYDSGEQPLSGGNVRIH